MKRKGCFMPLITDSLMSSDVSNKNDRRWHLIYAEQTCLWILSASTAVPFLIYFARLACIIFECHNQRVAGISVSIRRVEVERSSGEMMNIKNWEFSFTFSNNNTMHVDHNNKQARLVSRMKHKGVNKTYWNRTFQIRHMGHGASSHHSIFISFLFLFQVYIHLWKLLKVV